MSRRHQEVERVRPCSDLRVAVAVAVGWALAPSWGWGADTPNVSEQRSNAALQSSAGIQLAEIFDDNIFATLVDPEADWITVVSPGFEIAWDSLRHSARVGGGADLAFYAKNDAQNTKDWWVDGEVQSSLTAKTEIFSGVRFARWHEDRTSPDSFFGLEPTLLFEKKGYVGASSMVGPLGVRMGATVTQLNFQDVLVPGGVVNMDDRDRHALTAGGRLNFWASPAIEFYGEGAVDRRQYRLPVDDFGFARDSHGYQVRVGVQQQSGATVAWELYAGALSQDYVDPDLEDVWAPNLGGYLEWMRASTTRLRLEVQRSIDETTIPGASGVLYTQATARLEHLLAPGLTGNLFAGDGRSEFTGVGRTDDMMDFGMGVRADITRHWFVAADYGLLHRRSTAAFARHWRNQFMLRVGVQAPEAVRDTFRWTRLNTAGEQGLDTAPSGLFFGPMLSINTLSGQLSGARGRGQSAGEVSAEPGTAYWASGGFGGIGTSWGPWYVGGQIGGVAGSDTLRHARLPLGREITLSHGSVLMGALQLGYQLPGAMLYGTGGAMQTEFHAEDITRQNASSVTARRTGPLAGVGLRIPTGENFFVQLEQTHAGFGDIAVGEDRIDDIHQAAFHLGFGYRFPGSGPATDGEEARRSADREPNAASGAYAGVALATSQLTTEVTGPRDTGSAFNGDFSDGGIGAGIFAGYGWPIYRGYLGLEAGIDSGGAEAGQARTALGSPSSARREFSIDRQGAGYLDARLGWVMPSGVLIFGRMGVTRAFVLATYVREGQLTLQDERVNGVRFGVGADVPLRYNTFLRFEHTQSQYEPFFVDYGSGRDKFSMRESVTGLGLGMRF